MVFPLLLGAAAWFCRDGKSYYRREVKFHSPSRMEMAPTKTKPFDYLSSCKKNEQALPLWIWMAPMKTKPFHYLSSRKKFSKRLLKQNKIWSRLSIVSELTISWHFVTAWLICSKLSVGIPVIRASSVSFGLRILTKFSSSNGIGASTPPASKMTGTPAVLASWRKEFGGRNYDSDQPNKLWYLDVNTLSIN